MFFTGSLTTILPYLSTIILMLAFHWVDVSCKNVTLSTSSEGMQETLVFDDLSSYAPVSMADFYLEQNKNQVIPKCFLTADVSFGLLQKSALRSRKGNTDSNKAPPAL